MLGQRNTASIRRACDRKKFDYRFVVRTDEFKEHDGEGGKPADDAPASSAAQRKDPTWKGAVIKIDRQNGTAKPRSTASIS